MAARFHIHFDGKSISPELETWAIKQHGFWWDNFLHDIPGADGYAPARHLTQKPTNAGEFRGLCEEIFRYLDQHSDQLVGYVECEVIARREQILWKEFDPSVEIPFTLELSNLSLGQFRETEIHVSIRQGESDPRLFAKLKQMGL